MAWKRWKHSTTCVHNIAYHLIWCPKYRRDVLVGEVEARLRQLLSETAAEHGWEIGSMEIMPDHVHLFVRTPPVDSPHFVVQQFKGGSSRTLRSEFPHLRRRIPTLWTRSYYCESVGCLLEDAVRRYIENQKNV